ncbi:MAG: hypothetical protein LBK65_09150, partial [Tannerellaceae bacterium]|nr:hypothetical protein [Tannerellaceae bacterium]
MSKHVWKVWLRPNNLTSSKTDFIAEVDAAGKTRRMQDLIDRIMEEGSEVKAETVRAIADRLNAVKRDFILEGYSVFDDFAHFTPRVSGAWTGTEVFSPGKHRITVDAVMSG